MTTSPSPDSPMHAWIEAEKLPLIVDDTYRLGLDLTALRDRVFSPESPDSAEFQLVVTGFHWHTRNFSRKVTLLRDGPVEPVFFDITPKDPGKPLLRITVFYLDQFSLIVECEISTEVIAS